jgi:hypothetical protein
MAKVLATIPVKLAPLYLLVLCPLALVLVTIISLAKKQISWPFSISDAAKGFPSYLFFRIIWVPGGVFIVLLWFIVSRWVRSHLAKIGEVISIADFIFYSGIVNWITFIVTASSIQTCDVDLNVHHTAMTLYIISGFLTSYLSFICIKTIG